jgi:hypothetical protein
VASAPPPNPPGFGAQSVPKIEVTGPDGVAEPEARFFNAQQLRLCESSVKFYCLR